MNTNKLKNKSMKKEEKIQLSGKKCECGRFIDFTKEMRKTELEAQDKWYRRGFRDGELNGYLDACRDLEKRREEQKAAEKELGKMPNEEQDYYRNL